MTPKRRPGSKKTGPLENHLGAKMRPKKEAEKGDKKGVRHNQRPWAAPGAQRAPRGAKEAKKGGTKGPDEGQKVGFGSFRLKIVKSNKNTLFAMFEAHHRSRITSISGDLWLPKSVPKLRGDRCVPK